MNVEAFLSSAPRGLVQASRIVRTARRVRGRPPTRVRLSLDSIEDVDTARRYGVPVYLLTSELVTALGYPIVFPAQLLVAPEIDGAIDSPFPRIVVRSAEAALRPHIEDLVVALLRIDALAARGLAVRNRASVDPRQLLRRVLQAEMELEATRVNLQELAPAIPRIGTPLPQPLLEEQDRNSVVVGLRG